MEVKYWLESTNWAETYKYHFVYNIWSKYLARNQSYDQIFLFFLSNQYKIKI